MKELLRVLHDGMKSHSGSTFHLYYGIHGTRDMLFDLDIVRLVWEFNRSSPYSLITTYEVEL